MLKTVVRAGRGAETPADGATVRARVLGEPAGGGGDGGEGGSRRNVTLDFTLGDGRGGEALRLTLMSMLRTERAKMRAARGLLQGPLLSEPSRLCPPRSPSAFVDSNSNRAACHCRLSLEPRRCHRSRHRSRHYRVVFRIPPQPQLAWPRV